MIYKFNIGDRVVFDGLIAKVESRSTVADTTRPLYGLVSEEDHELTCSTEECNIQLYQGEEIEQEERLSDARFESSLTRGMVNSITDKYCPDQEKAKIMANLDFLKETIKGYKPGGMPPNSSLTPKP